MNYNSVYRIAMNDISEHNRELHKNKPKGFLRDYIVGTSQLWTKEVRRLNRELGLSTINLGNNKHDMNFLEKY